MTQHAIDHGTPLPIGDVAAAPSLVASEPAAPQPPVLDDPAAPQLDTADGSAIVPADIVAALAPADDTPVRRLCFTFHAQQSPNSSLQFVGDCRCCWSRRGGWLTGILHAQLGIGTSHVNYSFQVGCTILGCAR